MSYAEKIEAARAAIEAEDFTYAPNGHYRIGMRLGAALIALAALSSIL